MSHVISVGPSTLIEILNENNKRQITSEEGAFWIVERTLEPVLGVLAVGQQYGTEGRYLHGKKGYN